MNITFHYVILDVSDIHVPPDYSLLAFFVMIVVIFLAAFSFHSLT